VTRPFYPHAPGLGERGVRGWSAPALNEKQGVHSVVNSYFRYRSSTRVLDTVLDRVLEQYKSSIRTALFYRRHCATSRSGSLRLSSQAFIASVDLLVNNDIQSRSTSASRHTERRLSF